jgi:hypothetical protein
MLPVVGVVGVTRACAKRTCSFRLIFWLDSFYVIKGRNAVGVSMRKCVGVVRAI